MKQTKLTFTQEPHCCMPTIEGEPSVTMELHDGGGGDYLVLHAHHWAMDSEREVDILAAELKAMLAKANKLARVKKEQSDGQPA